MQVYFYDEKLYLHIEADNFQDVFFVKDYISSPHAKWKYIDLQTQQPETALALLLDAGELVDGDNKKYYASTFYTQAKKELISYRNTPTTSNTNIQKYHDCKRAMQNLYKDVQLSEVLDFRNFETAWENAFNERFYPKDNGKSK